MDLSDDFSENGIVIFFRKFARGFAFALIVVVLLAALLFGVHYFNPEDESFDVFRIFVSGPIFWITGGVFCVINGVRAAFSREE